ncbi:MAG: nitroreductase [Bacteroides sp. SM23_62_1]|nr:MAG: nitroreductase [Bacteroides sp. SM23_62_1]
MLKDLILRNRSYRRFYEELPVTVDQLKEFIDMARLSASARNAQSLKYIISNDPAINRLIFPTLAWAGYLKDWPGPAEGERPSAYIIMLNDTTISTNYYCDDGIAAQSILLCATEKGFGGCIIASVNRDELARQLNIPDTYKIIQVLALGKSKEKVVIEEVGEDGDIRYWRDEDQVHHVPKRALREIIVRIEAK